MRRHTSAALLLASALLAACAEEQEDDHKSALKINIYDINSAHMALLEATPPEEASALEVGASVWGMDVSSQRRLVLTGDDTILYLSPSEAAPRRYDADGADDLFFRPEGYAFMTLRRSDRRLLTYSTQDTTPQAEVYTLPGESPILAVTPGEDRRDLWVLTQDGLLQRYWIYGFYPQLDPPRGPWPGARALARRGAEVLVITDDAVWESSTGARLFTLDEPLDAGLWEPCHQRLYGRAGERWVALDGATGQVAQRGQAPAAGRGIYSGAAANEVWLGGEEGLVALRFTAAPLAFVSEPPLRVQAGARWEYAPQTNQSGPGCPAIRFEARSALPLEGGFGLSWEATCDRVGEHAVIAIADDGRGPIEQPFTLEVFDADDDGDGVLGCDDACPGNPDLTRPGERDAYGDPCLLDEDGDGLPDDAEVALGSRPLDADTDDDGLLDGQEPNPGADGDGDGLINILDPDSDGDGLTDGQEVNSYGTDPEDRDSDDDAFLDGEEVMWGSNPLDPKSPAPSFRAAQKPVDEAECSAAAPAAPRGGGAGGAWMALGALLAALRAARSGRRLAPRGGGARVI